MTSTTALRRWLRGRARLPRTVALACLVFVLATLPRLQLHAHAHPGDAAHSHAAPHATAHDAHDAHDSHDSHDAHGAADTHAAHGGAGQPPPLPEAAAETHVHHPASVTLALPDFAAPGVAPLPPDAWPGPSGRAASAARPLRPPYRPPIVA